MEKRNLRVIVASEYPQGRDFLKEVVEKEERTFLVGQAQDVTKTATLARNLRPDVAIIDCNLPYSVGLDTVRLSRISGWDTAQAICEMVPNTRVIIINNLDRQVLAKAGLNWGSRDFLSRERIEGNTVLKLQELCQEVMLPNAPVFANIDVEAWPVPQPKDNEATHKTVFLGTWSIATGLYLIGTLWLAPYGVLLVLAGVVKLGFDLVRRITARSWLKQR